MEYGPLQCMGKVGDKVHDKVQDKFPTKSRTQNMKVGNVIRVTDFHDLCPRTCPRVCCKVGVMEFGLYEFSGPQTKYTMDELHNVRLQCVDART